MRYACPMKVKKAVQKLLVVKIQLKLTANLLEKDDIRSCLFDDLMNVVLSLIFPADF